MIDLNLNSVMGGSHSFGRPNETSYTVPMFCTNEKLDEEQIGYILHDANVKEFRWMNMDDTLRVVLLEKDSNLDQKKYVPYWSDTDNVHRLIPILVSNEYFIWSSTYHKYEKDGIMKTIRRRMVVYYKLPDNESHVKSE